QLGTLEHTSIVSTSIVPSPTMPSPIPPTSTMLSPNGTTLDAKDADSSLPTGYPGTAHVSSSDSTATLPANYTRPASYAGVHTFSSAVILPKKGKQSLTVTNTQNSALTADDSIPVV